MNTKIGKVFLLALSFFLSLASAVLLLNLLWAYGDYSFAARGTSLNLLMLAQIIVLMLGIYSFFPINWRVWKINALAKRWIYCAICSPLLVFIFWKLGPPLYILAGGKKV